MNAREIREQIGRVKPYYLRNEILRAVTSLVSALGGIGNTMPGMDLRGPLREAIQLISRDQKVKDFLKGPLAYQPGQERLIYTQLVQVQAMLQSAENFESREDALKRKLQLDQAFNRGLRSLEQNRVSEADTEFNLAISFYKNEDRIFYMIAAALLAAGEVRRAYPYAKQGMEVQGKDASMQILFAEINRQRAELKNAPE